MIGVLVWNRTGISDQQFIDYYRGNEAADVYAKTPAQLLEVTHFHLFSYPVFLLIQGHIFLMTSWSRKIKVALVAAAFLGAALYLAVPWLVAFVSPKWVWLKWAGRILLGPSLLVFLVVPVFEMWFKRGLSGRRHGHGGGPGHGHARAHAAHQRHHRHGDAASETDSGSDVPNA